MEDLNKIIYDDEEVKLLKLANKKKKRKRRKILKAIIVLVVLVILCGMYLGSDLSKCKSLHVEGNVYYSESDILKKLGFSYDTPYLFTYFDFLFDGDLKNDSLIESYNIDTSLDGSVNISIKEKRIVGYYVDKNKKGEMENRLLLSDTSNVLIDSEHLDRIVEYPQLINFDLWQRIRIAVAFNRKNNSVDDDIVAMIAEILPHQESYDSQMLKIVMQDGNTFYTSLDTVGQLNAYKGVLKELNKEHVCLIMVPNTDTIQTEDCSDFE